MPTLHGEQGPLPLWAHPGSKVVGFGEERLQEKHVAAGLHFVQNMN